jgi:hypothetical protein
MQATGRPLQISALCATALNPARVMFSLFALIFNFRAMSGGFRGCHNEETRCKLLPETNPMLRWRDNLAWSWRYLPGGFRPTNILCKRSIVANPENEELKNGTSRWWST